MYDDMNFDSCSARWSMASLRAGCIQNDQGCWIWQGAKTQGYPVANTGEHATATRLNRVILRLKLGRDLRPGAFACHTCDNRTCLNPDHIYEGSTSQNGLDAWQNPNRRRHFPEFRRLSDEEARAILESSESSRTLGAKFGVSHRTVQKIRNGERYKNV